ncbi:portal protein [Gordonia phage GodonK]|uniref:Portal protein n=1 Tax=Gordonia phage GodonK TaxID=2562192 RepID=A0A4D6E401_9CAUD|nr:portal protein [Gordonia phage GodonK]QBZ72685.1 portal protein [Gordonia phage GodonK]
MKFGEVIRTAADPDRVTSGFTAAMAARPVNYPRPLVASGEKISIKNPDEVISLRNRVYTEWQNDAWAYYDAIGEIKYGFGLVGAVTSRLRLYPAISVDQDGVPISTSDYRRRQLEQSKPELEKDIKSELAVPKRVTKDVLEHLDRLVLDLFGGPAGSSGFLRSYALNMCVAGECYLVNYKDRWLVKSTSELTADPSGKLYMRGLRTGSMGSTTTGANGTFGEIELPKNTFVARIWREHPRYSLEPESSMLGLRETCDELITLQRMIRSLARSRMNAGILFVPDGLSAAGSTVAEDIADEEELDDELISSIYDTVSAPIEDETNAASVFPTIMRGPESAGKALQHLMMSRDSDQFLVERCDRALDRILQGLDMPKDVVSGMSNVKYSNAIQVDDSLYKGHIEPLALMLCDALTTVYIRPMLKKKFPQLEDSDLDFLRIWYDPSEIVSKSDPAQSANTGHDNFAISDAAWRAAHGFSDTDAPSEREMAIRWLRQVPPSPEVQDMLIKEAFPTIIERQRAANIQASPVPMPESAQEMVYGKVVSPVSDTTRDAQNPQISPRDVSTVGSKSEDQSGMPAGFKSATPTAGKPVDPSTVTDEDEERKKTA